MDFLKIKKLHSMDGKKSIGIACYRKLGVHVGMNANTLL